MLDGLKGSPRPSPRCPPDAVVQTCIAYLMGHSVGFASWKKRKMIVAAPKPICRACSAAAAAAALNAFD